MIQTKKRIAWVDMAKGYGMILVILGHCGVGSLEKWIYTFHLPLFFFLSGYVFRAGDSFAQFLKKKWKGLLVPYFCLGIPLLAVDWGVGYLTGEYAVLDGAKLVYRFLLQRRLMTLWCLACLFFLNILFYFTVKLLKTDGKLAAFAVLSTALGAGYYSLGGKALPWNVDVCLMAYPFFFGGYWYHRAHTRTDPYTDDKRKSPWLFAGFAVLNVLFGWLSFRISGAGLEMYKSSYGVVPFTYLSAFAGIACTVLLAKWFSFRPVQYIGENSLLYFAWHQELMIPIALRCLKLVHLTLSEGDSLGYTVLFKTLQVLLILGITTVCNLVISRTRLRVMLGKG